MPRDFTLLHLSDLHFGAADQSERWFSALAEDLRRELDLREVDALVMSGDIVDRGKADGYPAAGEFIDRFCAEFRTPRERVVIVPGNHDLDRRAAEAAIEQVPRRGKVGPGEFEASGKRYRIRDVAAYRRRFSGFAQFFQGTLGRTYPLDPAEQGMIWSWPDLRVVVLGLSSVSEIDGYRPGRATIDDLALSRAIDRLRMDDEQEQLKIAVFHHPLHSPGDDRLRDPGFLDRLAQAGFCLALHGHVHAATGDLFRYDRTARGRRIEIIAAGTFGARADELPTGYPWQYNVLRVQGERVRVETRRRESESSSWKPDARWSTGAGKPPNAFYELDLEVE